MVMPGSTVICKVSASTGDLDGLAGVGEAYLDLLPADHDHPAHRNLPAAHAPILKRCGLPGFCPD